MGENLMISDNCLVNNQLSEKQRQLVERCRKIEDERAECFKEKED